MKFEIPLQVEKALSLLHGAGFQAYMVGGCVRDYVMGKIPNDYDITTSALPEETKNVFKGYPVIETGIKHGTITVVIDNMNLEITTYRIEKGYSDGRHPDEVEFTPNLKADAARRDFTMNALAYDGREHIIDFFGGLNDIKEGKIKCVGPAELRFGEDGLRIMRALRFAAVLGFEIEEETSKAIFRCKDLLKAISAERIREEFLKLICGANAKAIILKYADVLGVIMPEILDMKGFEQKNSHHVYDVLTHSVVCMENVSADPVLRMAAILHDVGKPRCFTMDDEGVGHFYGHAKHSEELSHEILNRLKFDNETKRQICMLVKHHDALIDLNERAVKRALNKLGDELYFKVLNLKRGDNLAQNPDYRFRLQYIDQLEDIGRKILEEETCFNLKDLAVNGKDLIDIGIQKGKKIGIVLDDLLNKVIDGELSNTKDVLVRYVESSWLN